MARATLGLAITSGWVAGIFYALYGPSVLLVFILIQVLLLLAVSPKTYWLFGFFPTLICLLFGLLYANFRIAYQDLNLSRLTSAHSFRGMVATDPKDHGTYQSFRLIPAEGGSFEVLAPNDLKLSYGDNLALTGRLEPPEKKGDYFVLPFPAIASTHAASTSPGPMKFLYSFRSRNAEIIRRMLPADQGSLMAGLILGSIHGISEDARNAMRNSGTSHIVALSGYNVSIIILALIAALKGRVSRRWLWAITTVSILLFVLMSGSEPSIARAGLMAFLLLWSAQLGRAYSFPHAILWTAALMLAWAPHVALEAGFLLSFLSLLGISYGARPLQVWLSKLKLPKNLSETIAITLAAQLAVMPLLLSMFGKVSLFAVVANILILPLVPLTMAMGFASLALYWIVPILGTALAKLAVPFLAYILFAIEMFSRYAVPLRFTPTFPMALAYYVALIFLLRRFRAPNHFEFPHV